MSLDLKKLPKRESRSNKLDTSKISGTNNKQRLANSVNSQLNKSNNNVSMVSDRQNAENDKFKWEPVS